MKAARRTPRSPSQIARAEGLEPNSPSVSPSARGGAQTYFLPMAVYESPMPLQHVASMCHSMNIGSRCCN